MCEDDKRALWTVRRQINEIGRREEGLREMRQRTIGSPRIDGMPGGGSNADAATGRLIRIETLERELKRERSKAERMQKATRNRLRSLRDTGMSEKEHIFCDAYFCTALDVYHSSILAGVSERTAMRYIKAASLKEEQTQKETGS